MAVLPINELKEKIDDNIYQNSQQAITGARMNTILNDMVDSLDETATLNALSIDLNDAKQGVETNAEAITAQGEKLTELEQEVILGGLHRIVSNDIPAYNDYILPAPIPLNTHFIMKFSANESKTLYINYSDADALILYDIKEQWEAYALVEIRKIRTSVTCAIEITIINEELLIGEEKINTNNIKDDAITTDKVAGTHIISTNLFNKDTSLDGYYVDETSGVIRFNESGRLSASDFIPIEENASYYSYPQGNRYACYDIYKRFISGGNGNLISTPSGSVYIRITTYVANKDVQMLNRGTNTMPYEPYYHKVINPNIIGGLSDEYLNKARTITSRLWNKALESYQSELNSGETLMLSDYPKALKKGDKLSFFGNITDFNNGIIIGKGESDYISAYAEITPTEIILKSNDGSGETIRGQEAHQLTITDYIKLIIDIYPTKWVIILQTLNGVAECEINCSYSNGTPRITSNGASLTNVRLTCTNEYFAKPIWMFGDSYYGMSSEVREMYWLEKWGYLNCLVQGYGGQSSIGVFPELEKCLAISRPKYIVWSIGMNDSTFDIWQSYITRLEAICETYNIELILQTIPQPYNQNYEDKDAMSEWVRQSGYRYIDAAGAVGSNAEGEWYGVGTEYNHQSSDNIHPSKYGALAIATQFLVDFPELMQY